MLNDCAIFKHSLIKKLRSNGLMLDRLHVFDVLKYIQENVADDMQRLSCVVYVTTNLKAHDSITPTFSYDSTGFH